MSISQKLYAISLGHLMGVSAQLFSAVPIVLVTVYVSRTIGPEALIDLTLMIAASAISYTVALLGLRHWMVIDRLATHDFTTYCTIRVVLMAFAAVVLFVFGTVQGILPTLIFMIILLRLGDLMVDLVLAADQVRLPSGAQLSRYFQASVIKFLVILLGMAGAYQAGLHDPFLSLLAASALYTGYAAMLLIRTHRSEAPRQRSTERRIAGSWMIVKATSVFLVAQIVCSLLTSYPRLALAGLEDVNLAGAAAGALAAATLVGMVYQSVWLRWAPKLGKGDLNPQTIGAFLLELLIVSGLGAVLVVLFAADIVAFIYGFAGNDQTILIQQILLWSITFFGVMVVANLFKPSRIPWAESLTYITGLGAAVGLNYFTVDAPIWALLASATLGMLTVEMIFAGVSVLIPGKVAK